MQKIKKFHLDWIGVAMILVLAIALLWVKGTSSEQAPEISTRNSHGSSYCFLLRNVSLL